VAMRHPAQDGHDIGELLALLQLQQPQPQPGPNGQVM
jgi:hypothetical protein